MNKKTDLRENSRAILDKYKSFQGRQMAVPASRFEEVVSDLLSAFSEVVEEIVGEDEHVYGLKNVKYKQCPQCNSSEGEYHKSGCKYMLETIINRFRQQQRQKLKEILQLAQNKIGGKKGE